MCSISSYFCFANLLLIMIFTIDLDGVILVALICNGGFVDMEQGRGGNEIHFMIDLIQVSV